jgi:hypothetical protein
MIKVFSGETPKFECLETMLKCVDKVGENFESSFVT